MAKVYTINSGGTDPDGPDLIGLQIVDLGNDQFELVQVLATAEGTGGPPKLPSFSFNNFKNWNWTLTALTKTEGTNRTMSGHWTNTDPAHQPITGDQGDWTATGTGTGDDEETQAASA